MKIKQQPDDFLVEEITDVVPTSGPFAFYRLDKVGWSSPDALAAVRRRWNIDPRRLSYGGLKDRHARTSQYLTIHLGPQRGLRHQAIALHYLGQLPDPYDSSLIRCNRFRLVLRDLDPLAVELAQRRLVSVQRDGLPNYFDDQRFGSVAGAGSEFVGRLLVRGDFEGALRLALQAPYEHDRPEQKREKRILEKHWGDWGECMQQLPRGHARSLADYLRLHPGDYKGAILRLRPELRSLYLSVYQSYLWNRLLARWLETHLPAEHLRSVQLRLGTVPVPTDLDEVTRTALAMLQLPLPSARLHLEETDPLVPLVNEVVEADGFALRDLQVRGVRELFFSRGERAALVSPDGLTAEFTPDSLHPGKDKLTLAFDLPRGCYATMVIKALTA